MIIFPEHTIPLAEALLAGGVSAVELTLRTESALDVMKTMREKFPEILLGAGTVLRPEQVKKVAGLGADFAVASCLHPIFLKSLHERFRKHYILSFRILIVSLLACSLIFMCSESKNGYHHKAYKGKNK